MLPVADKDRMRILTAVASRGPSYEVKRIVVITASLIILAAVPLTGLVRVDLWDGRHVLLGERVDGISALKGVVVAIGALWGTTFLTNVVVGRFFCGWGCPVGYVGRLGENVDLGKRKARWRWALSHLAGAGFVATFIGAILLWWVDPRVLLEGSTTARAVTLGVFLVLSGGGFLHAFVWRFGFCRSACPIGLYYRFVTSRTPVSLVFDTSHNPCLECGACEKVCPVDIDPKRVGEPVADVESVDGPHAVYGDAECIRCGDCVEACRMVYKGREGEEPVLFFGRPKGRRVAAEGADDAHANASG